MHGGASHVFHRRLVRFGLKSGTDDFITGISLDFFLETTNLMLIAVALVSGTMLLMPVLRARAGASSVSSLEATQLINQKNAILVDVRSPEEFTTGTILGARNFPGDSLVQRAGTELSRFKARPVIVLCETGGRSVRMVAELKKAGFAEVYNLAGGVGGWRQAGLPLSRSASRDQTSGGAKKEKS